MSNIKILDCTLRDGGYINNWQFGQKVIHDIIENLIRSNVDIIECGFIRDVELNNDSSVFSSMEHVSKIINPKKNNVLYAVMIELHNYKANLICNCRSDTADIIRLTFRKNEWIEAKKTALELMKKGYKVCIQPVGTASYDASSLINLIQDVNNINPFAFYLVDTLGVMYRHEMRKFFYLIDDSLNNNISLGFHSHNNLQMSFANAQEFIRLNRNRSLLIDASCYGMGRGVGNLATELIADYINNNIEQTYSITPILNIVDKYLMPIYAQQRWGYELPYFLSATFKCHPTYASHLIKKETLSIEKIEKILSLIPENKRNEYDSEYIENLYHDILSFRINDENSYYELSDIVHGKEIVIIGPGTSVVTYLEKISSFVRERTVISINFIPNNIKTDALFISNSKRLGAVNLSLINTIIATSNLKNELEKAIFFNYTSLLGEGDASDNSGSMLIRILKKCGVKKIYLAGFDGFDLNSINNFAIETFASSIDYETAQKKNNDISKQLNLALDGLNYEFITPTKYEISNI